MRGVTDNKDQLRIFNSEDNYGKRQLQEMYDYASKHEVPFNLVISERTTYITGDVADFVRKSGGQVLQFDGVSKFTKVDIGSTLGQAWKRPKP